jgi:hypothetical protein
MKRFRVSFVPFVVDEAVSKSMNFKPNVLTAFKKICVPFKMNEDYESWLRIVPLKSILLHQN